MSNETEVESGQRDEGSLSEANASGSDPQNKLVKVNQRCYSCLAVPIQNDGDN